MSIRPVFAALFLSALPIGACAQVAAAPASSSLNSIQPETTLSVSAQGDVRREPDIAFINTGVQTEARTAEAAMSENAERMTSLFDALTAAGVERKDMQTSNFSLQPNYDYSSRGDGPPRLVGYIASNQVTVKVRDLDTLGETMDALVGAGGNTFSGLSFALDDDKAASDEARTLAMETAIARAEIYAKAAGYKVDRIVSISENSDSVAMPMDMMRVQTTAVENAASTPIAGGEVGYTANVTVVFELTR